MMPPAELPPLPDRVEAVRRVVAAGADRLRAAPEALPSLLHTALGGLGWPPDAVAEALGLPPDEPALRVRAVHRTRPPDGRTSFQHEGAVVGCAVAPPGSPGPRIVSWSTDGTVRFWEEGVPVTLRLHAGEVTGCAVVGDGRLLASGGRDGRVVLTSLEPGAEHALREWWHEGEVLGFGASRDGRELVSWSADGTVRLWDPDSAGHARAVLPHGSPVTACALTADGVALVSGCADGTVRLWDVSGGTPLATLPAHAGAVTALLVTPDDSHVVSCSHDRTVRVRPLPGADTDEFGPEEPRDAGVVLEGHALGVLGAALSPDGALLATWSLDRTIRVWDAAGLVAGSPPVAPVHVLAGHEGAVLDCAFLPGGDLLVSASADRTLRVWDVRAGTQLHRLEGHERAVRCLAVGEDDSGGAVVVSGSDDRTLRTWDAGEGREVAVLDGSQWGVNACLADPTDALRAVWGAGQLVESIDVDGETEPIAGLPESVAPVAGAALSRDGTVVAAWGREGDGIAFDRSAGELKPSAVSHPGRTRGVAVTSRPFRVLSGSADGQLRVWDETTWTVLQPDRHRGPIAALVLAPDETRAVTASWDGTLGVWELEAGRRILTLAGHADRVLACAVSPDGTRVASASADRTVRLWELETGRELATLAGHDAEVTGCLFTASGRVVSWSWDGTVRAWNAAGQPALPVLRGHAERVTGVAVDDEAGVLYSCSADASVRAWELETGESRGVLHGPLAFRAVAVVAGGAVAGDDAGTLWVLDLADPPAPPNARPR